MRGCRCPLDLRVAATPLLPQEIVLLPPPGDDRVLVDIDRVSFLSELLAHFDSPLRHELICQPLKALLSLALDVGRDSMRYRQHFGFLRLPLSRWLLLLLCLFVRALEVALGLFGFGTLLFAALLLVRRL